MIYTPARQVSIIESFAKEVEAKDLEATLRMEYRSKLLNPKWAQAMAAQGSGGAYEISQRMTALVGWGGTAEFREQWVFDGAAETYALDPEMARKLADSNPEAFRNIVKRMLEAHGRGYWEASDDVLEQLKDLYSEAEDEIELSGGKGVRTSVVRQQQEPAAPAPAAPAPAAPAPAPVAPQKSVAAAKR
jgi:magnesium chelatase subunit H